MPSQVIDPRRLKQSKAARSEDFASGLKKGKEIAPEGSLGRLGNKKNADIESVLKKRRESVAQRGITPEQQQVLAQRQKQLGGFTPEEMARQRSQSQKAAGRATQQGLRQLRGAQAGSGLRGGLAAGQQASLIRGGQQAQVGAEQQLGLANIQERRRALDALEKTTTGLAGQEQASIGALEGSSVGQSDRQEGRDIFDIGQLGREKNIQLQTALAEQVLGTAERGAIRAADIAKAQERAADSGGKK